MWPVASNRYQNLSVWWIKIIHEIGKDLYLDICTFKFHGLLFYVAHGMAIALLTRWKNSNALKRKRKMHFIWLTNPALESQLKLERIVTHLSW